MKTVIGSGMFACLPIIELRQGITLDTLKRCCDPESLRYKMNEPFVEQGNASATNGRIGIRVFDSMHVANPDSPVRLPPLSRSFDQLWRPSSTWRDLNGTFIPRDDSGCQHCMSRGYLGTLVECEQCEGTGEADFYPEGMIDYDDIPECDHCVGGWRSSIVCQACKGKPYRSGLGGVYAMDTDLHVDAGYYNLVASLPGAMWNVYHPKLLVHGRALDDVMLVKFEGGQGMIAGVTLAKQE